MRHHIMFIPPLRCTTNGPLPGRVVAQRNRISDLTAIANLEGDNDAARYRERLTAPCADCDRARFQVGYQVDLSGIHEDTRRAPAHDMGAPPSIPKAESPPATGGGGGRIESPRWVQMQRYQRPPKRAQEATLPKGAGRTHRLQWPLLPRRPDHVCVGGG